MIVKQNHSEGLVLIEKTSFWKWYLVQVILRLLRLYPSYLISFMIFSKLQPHLVTGTRTPALVLQSRCNESYLNLFLVSNLFESDTPCLL